MRQKSFVDFYIVLSDLLSEVLDVPVKKGVELSTDNHLVVCSLRISKPLPNRKLHRSSAAYRIKWEALAESDVKKQFASSMATKYRQLPKVSEDIEVEWSLCPTAMTSLAVQSCVISSLEWWQIVRKKRLGGIKMLKKLSKQRKMLLKPCCKRDHHLICNHTVKMSKEHSLEELGLQFVSNYLLANKVFWQTIRHLHWKSLSARISIKDLFGDLQLVINVFCFFDQSGMI